MYPFDFERSGSVLGSLPPPCAVPPIPSLPAHPLSAASPHPYAVASLPLSLLADFLASSAAPPSYFFHYVVRAGDSAVVSLLQLCHKE